MVVGNREAQRVAGSALPFGMTSVSCECCAGGLTELVAEDWTRLSADQLSGNSAPLTISGRTAVVEGNDRVSLEGFPGNRCPEDFIIADRNTRENINLGTATDRCAVSPMKVRQMPVSASAYG